jgi:hypothetical protein
MQPINVVSYPHDRITCSAATMVNEILALYGVRHCEGFGHLPMDAKGAIIMFHGQQDAPKPNIGKRLSGYAQELEWVLWISIGDEGCEFPYDDLDHPRQRKWIQTPKPGKVKADRYLIEGYHPNTRTLLGKSADVKRDFDGFFAGQVNHTRRQECVASLQDKIGVYVYPTDSFMAGLSMEEYYGVMKRAKLVPCPAGPLTPDSFRFAEALEAGCIPILDAFSPDRVAGYWDMVLESHPFRVVEDWDTLPRVMDEILERYEENQRAAKNWWHWYKLRMRTWMRQDLEAL